VALRRAIVNSSVSGLCITKLDVLDGLDTIRICVGYRVNGEVTPEPPLSARGYAGIEPVYEELPGWPESTVGVTTYQGCRSMRAATRAPAEPGQRCLST